jgi:predicted DNA-binding ribbon-helix-helix protein
MAVTNVNKQGLKMETSRLSINLPTRIYKDLKQVAESEGLTITEVVRRALSAERLLREAVADGGTILIKEKGSEKPTRLVVFK